MLGALCNSYSYIFVRAGLGWALSSAQINVNVHWCGALPVSDCATSQRVVLNQTYPCVLCMDTYSYSMTSYFIIYGPPCHSCTSSCLFVYCSLFKGESYTSHTEVCGCNDAVNSFAFDALMEY